MEKKGLRLAKQVHPLLITLRSVVMPDCDGWTVLNRPQERFPSWRRIPVIMVTVVDNEAMGLGWVPPII